jgi:CBS domain-containing protein
MTNVDLLTREAGTVMSPPPPAVLPSARCGEAIELMARQESACVTVVDANGALAGILTERDVTRRIAFRTEPDAPVADVMSAPVETVRTTDLLYQAVGQMRRLNLRHLPVVNNEGAVAGMLYLRDAMADATGDIIGQIDRLTHDATREGMAASRTAQIEVAAAMLENGMSGPAIQSLITHINRDIHARVVRRVLEEMCDDGLGHTPVPFAIVIMGSGGRDENYLRPDQDNGIIVADYPDDDHTAIDSFFIALAERTTDTLNAVGFPYCKGSVMAINPVWRKTLAQWREQTTQWARRRSVTTVRLADIFFDFQPVYGDPSLATALRNHVTDLMRDNLAFLAEINRDQAEFGTALGFFGRFRTIRDDGPFRGQVDIKKGALLPLVNAVRILALRDGIASTPTLARIAALRELGTLNVDDADELSAAFTVFSTLLMRRQIESFIARRPVGHAIPPGWPTRRERRDLKDGLRAVDRLRDRVSGELTGDVLTGGSGARPG